MNAFGTAAAIIGCVLAEVNCAHYQPHALNPSLPETQFRARTAPAELNAETLVATALANSADLETARAKLASAEAAVITAGQRINPGLNAEGGYNRTPDSVATYGSSLAFTIETAGKRGYRTLAAQKSAEAARIAVAQTEWQVRSRVRAALVTYYFAQQRLASLQAERDIRAEIVEIFSKRLSVGESSAPELNAARAEQASIAVSVKSAEGEIAQAIAGIADATGLPAAALDGRVFSLALFDTPPAPDTLPLLRAQRAGLLHRADIRQALAEYEASDARLRLTLANQYPNITLSPSYSFQEGFPAYVLASAIEFLPVLHRHEGPIAEAEAERREMEARFNALQARVIGETELALRQYLAAVAEWLMVRETVESVQQQRERGVVAAFNAGESDRLDVAQARLATLSAARARTDASQRAQSALGALEEAVQSYLSPETGN